MVMDELASLLTPEEAASALKIKVGTVYDWAAKGVLPHIRILAGKRRPVIRFRKEDLDRFLQERVVPSREVNR